MWGQERAGEHENSVPARAAFESTRNPLEAWHLFPPFCGNERKLLEHLCTAPRWACVTRAGVLSATLLAWYRMSF
jgi:hypothetical protein